MAVSETFIPFVSTWPTDVAMFRHGQPDRDNVQTPDMNDPNWEKQTQQIDMSQALKEIGHRQGKAGGQRLAVILPMAEICLSADYRRNLETAWDVTDQYPEESRPLVIPEPLMRERYRGADSPILISKRDFFEQFPDVGEVRKKTPSQWHPRGGHPYLGPQLRLAMALDVYAGMREMAQQPPIEQLLISTSGEFCMAQFNSPYFGNMTDEELVKGFGAGMPATEYEMTAITHYTKREDPEDLRSPRDGDEYGYMRVMTPNPQEPEGDLLWDTGWIQINRPDEPTYKQQ